MTATAATCYVAANGSDAFWAVLSDMHPRRLGRAATLHHLAAQRDGLSKALNGASSAASSLPTDEAAFLRYNLTHQDGSMVQTCEWLAQIETAAEALDRVGRAGCAVALTAAQAAFAEIPLFFEAYCRGPWEYWYRGCKKLNIEVTLKRTCDVLAQARGDAPAGTR